MYVSIDKKYFLKWHKHSLQWLPSILSSSYGRRTSLHLCRSYLTFSHVSPVNRVGSSIFSWIKQLWTVDGVPQLALCLLSPTSAVGSYKDMTDPCRNHVDGGRGHLEKVGRSFEQLFWRRALKGNVFETFSLRQWILGPAILLLFLQGYFSSVH